MTGHASIRRPHATLTRLGAALLATALTSGTASALVCARADSTGHLREGTTLKLRSVCRSTERAVDAAALGLGLRNLIVRTGNPISTNGTVSTPSNCDAGEVAAGGGALSVGSTGGDPAMRSSRPEPETDGATPTAWRVTVENTAGTGTITVTPYVVCGTP